MPAEISLELKELEKTNSKISEKRNSKKNPLDYTNWLSQLTFSWMTPLVWRGAKKTLELDDFWDLRDMHKAEKSYKPLQLELEKIRNTRYPFLAACGTFMKVYGPRFWFSGLMLLLSIIILSISPYFLKIFLDTISDKSKPDWELFVWAIAIGLSNFLGVNLQQYFFYHSQTVALQLKSALFALLYRKALKLSNRARVKRTNGEIVNLMSIDVQKLSDLCIFIHMGWSGIISIGVAVGMLFYLLGWTMVVGLGILVLTIPLHVLLMQTWQKFRRKNLKLSDSRMRSITEIIQGISIIKYFNWESNYAQVVQKIRNLEVKTLLTQTLVRSTLFAVMFSIPVFVSVGVFVLYYLMGNTLTASIVFSSITYFNQIRFPMMSMLSVIQFAIEGAVSINRLHEYFNFEEQKPLELGSKQDSQFALKLESCNFEWDEKPTRKTKKTQKKGAKTTKKKVNIEMKDEVGKLYDIDLEVKHGELVMIVGRVGSGKTSLISGIIGEMRNVSGNISINGSIAYCAQQAWIQNATLRDNITFGKPFDKEKYDQVIQLCALTKDLEILTYGDMTEIGEKGINLSGGQRQRVSLARAVYQDKDIYLFDDPLSALDAHIGKYIFDECILKHLKDKTRILITHQLQYLKFASQIILLEDGRIIEKGTYEELMNKEDGNLQRLINEYTAKESEKEKKEDEKKEQFVSSKKLEYKQSEEERKKLAKLMQDEERARGAISLKVIWNYFEYGGGPFAIFIILLLNGLWQAGTLMADYWISFWSDGYIKTLDDWGYISIYVGIGLTITLLNFCRAFVPGLIYLISANRIFSKSFENILRAPKWFFDTTPVGRFLSRFSKDLEMLDLRLPMFLQQLLGTGFTIIGVITIISINSYWFLCVAFPIMIVFIIIQQLYSKSSREVKRIEAIVRSPLFAHFSETLTGLPTIRSYKIEEDFIKQNVKLVDTNIKPWFVQFMLQRWLGIRLEFIGVSILLAGGLFMAAARHTISPGLVGVTMSYSMKITQVLHHFVTQWTESEIQFNAAERLLYYTETPTEPTLIKKKENEPEPQWPDKGEIVFKDYKMRYREGLDLVLKGLNFHIKPQEKIGIVGRTGAGKSSIILSIFRMMEAADGEIIIDGWKISDVNLSTLRKRLSIIPQEPVLFTGTIRSNLDPFKQYDDKYLWEVLENVHLKEKFKKYPQQLDAPVTEGGENFSVGERQLLCLARALCKKSKILLIDEATANVDLETDSLIQKTIDKEFSTCTRLTIAHRLNTIMNSDRILVMDNGYVAEFDTPKALLSNEKSLFSHLVNQTGPANAKLLREMVFGKTPK